MARQLTNVSGETLTLQDSHGRWYRIGDGEVYTVDSADQRYFQTGEQGEEPLWAELRPTKTSKTKPTTDEEAS